MDITFFVKCLREMSEFVSEFSYKDPENQLGDWRAVKQELKNGDVQGLIYRKLSEINIIYYSANTDYEIEMFVRANKQFEPLLCEAIEDYCNNHPVKNFTSGSSTATIYFETIHHFSKFIYKYLIPLGDV